MIEQIEIPEVAAMPQVRPAGYKKHHRWQWGWQKWLAVVHLMDRVWPRNS